MFLLDTTLRDGSYIVNFSFTPKDTYELCYFLDKAKIDFIEIGHGLGIGKKNILPYPIEEYYISANKAIKKAKWGVFFIPGIGGKEDIDKLVEYKANFIRIGIEPKNLKKSIEYIKYAKSKGLIVFLNLMKTYSVSPKNLMKIFEENKTIQRYIDVIYIVDSSGGMIYKDIQKYIDVINKVFNKIKLGFHGHNNLNLANFNSLYALENGVEFIDVSLAGLGRNAGNTISESFVLLLNKLNISKKYDYKLLMELSEIFIKPFVKNIKKDKISYIFGFADFHSSYYQKIIEFSKKYNIDEIDLILEISKNKEINISDILLQKISKKIYNKEKIKNFKIKAYEPLDSIYELYKKVVIDSKKFNKLSFINFVKDEYTRVSKLVHNHENAIFTSISYSNINELKKFTKDIPNEINFLYISTNDINERKFLKSKFLNKVIFYDNDKLKIYSILNYIKNFSPINIIKIKTIGSNLLYKKFLCEINNQKNFVIDDVSAEVLVLFENLDNVEEILKYKYVIDAKIGAVDINKLINPNLYKYNVYRIDIIKILSNFAKIDYDNFINLRKYYDIQDNNTYICNGLVGKKGDIIVDDVTKPSMIYGIADGKGTISFK